MRYYYFEVPAGLSPGDLESIAENVSRRLLTRNRKGVLGQLRGCARDGTAFRFSPEDSHDPRGSGSIGFYRRNGYREDGGGLEISYTDLLSYNDS